MKRFVLMAVLVLCALAMASPIVPDDRADREIRLNRFLHDGETEAIEARCAAGRTRCTVVRRRNGAVVAEVAIPAKVADSMVGSFFQILPPRAQRRVLGDRERLLVWNVRWLGRRTEGQLDRNERVVDEPFVDAVLSLEGALQAQFYGK